MTDWWINQNCILEHDAGYRAAMGVPAWVDGAPGQVEIHFNQQFTGFWGPLMVRIRVDGYEVHFPHNNDYHIPPLSQWVKIATPQSPTLTPSPTQQGEIDETHFQESPPGFR